MATTYTITVQSTVSGNKYFVNGVQQDSLTLQAGESYIFDQSDASNAGHPLALSTTSDGTHGGGSEYTYNVTKTGTVGTDRLVYFSPDNDTNTSLYYYCQVHAGMGGDISVSPQTQIDPQVNFFKSTLSGTYADDATSLTISTGDGALLPDPSVDGEYNLTMFRGLQVNQNTAFEIVRVLSKSGDVLTVNRGIEGTTALTVDSEVHSILMSATKKVFNDIDTQIENLEAYDQTLNTTSDVAFNSLDVGAKFELPILSSFPQSPTEGEMFFYSPSNSMIFYDGEAFQQIRTSYLVQLGLAEVTATPNGMTLSVSQNIGLATASATANNATTAFLSSSVRNLELATATGQGLDMTALTPEYLSFASSPQTSVNEGNGVRFTVTTARVTNGTTVGYTVTGISSADIGGSSLTGTITITDNEGFVDFAITADSTTEGAETMTVTLDATDSAGTSTGSRSDSVIINDTSITPPLTVEYLVIAGGGGGGGNVYNPGASGAGGGAGGYRNSTSGETSGGNSSAESTLTLSSGTNYTVTIGAGGSNGTKFGLASNGSNSIFHTITSTGGGAALRNGTETVNGGSGGGSKGSQYGTPASPGTGISGQGHNGGTGAYSTNGCGSGGGGGAGSVGDGYAVNQTGRGGKNGGSGLASSITGSSVGRAGGGAGGGNVGATGTSGGGNSGGYGGNGTSGSANYGGGGGGGGNWDTNGGAGGSGLVILRYPTDYTISFGAGLTGSESTVGGNKVATITSGSGNVSFTL